MVEYKRISVDTSKAVFALHGIDGLDRVVLRREVTRSGLEAFFAQQTATEVALEACGGSHHWGRVLGAQGHDVRLIPPQYVKPFVKRGKNDRNDAEAISEAASRPSMRYVAVKSADRQAAAMILGVRDLLVKQRTQAINALRGHAAEFGVIAARGTYRVGALLAAVASDGSVPAAAQRMLSVLGEQIAQFDGRIATLDDELGQAVKADETAARLTKVPGIGVIGAMTLSLTVDAGQFRSGRHFASWLGLVPKERSTAGRQRLGGISREGDERLRQVLVVGAMAVVRHAKPGRSRLVDWLLNLLGRCRSRKLAAVALANKLARIAWAMMARGEAYRSGAPMAA